MITLKTLPLVSAQQVFDQVVEHLRTQKAKSYREGRSCAYRGDNGAKCAAGCLISEDEYSAKMENETWDYLAKTGVVPADHDHLIKELQELHDDVDVIHWEEALKHVATRAKLEYKEPQQ